MQNELTVAVPNSAIQCSGVNAYGQCKFNGEYQSKDGLFYCKIHAHQLPRQQNNQAIRNYRLTKWQARIDEFSNNDSVKSLREEIGIVRMMLEEIINRCENTTDLILMSNKIGDLVMKAEKLVSSCHRLEASTGALLDKSTLIHLANILVEIVSEHIKDDLILDNISERILTTIKTASPISGPNGS